MSLFIELKRRNVFRVGAAYVVIGWLLLQVADVLLDNFGAPDWVFKSFAALLILGLPLALFLAWAFELTPEGVKRAEDVVESDSITPHTGKRVDRLIVVGLVAVIAILVAERFWSAGDADQEPGITADAPAAETEPVDVPGAPDAADTPEVPVVPVEKSIAVLPFADFSPGADQGWFADGLAEEILNALARTPDLKVASRTATFAFRDTSQSPAEIGAALKVAHILEGSVRRAADRIRVTAQLIRTSDGYHVWSENFDGSIEDAIAIQEQIAFQIARALKTAMDPDALAEMLAGGTRSVEAWEALLKAQALIQDASMIDFKLAENDLILASAQRAVEVDPGFSRAHGFMANFWQQQMTPVSAFYAATNLAPAEVRARFDKHIEDAIRTAGSEAERLAYQADRAWVQMLYADRVAYLREAMALRPEQADIHVQLGRALIEVGEYAEARDILVKAAALGRGTAPELVAVYQMLHRVDAEAALAMSDRALEMDAGSLQVLYQSHRVLLYAGRIERAADVARAYVLRDADSQFSHMLQVRQACAEGRRADADAIYALFNGDLIRWLMLKTLGRDAEARELLRPLDTPERLYALSTVLSYPFFDPGDYPLLADTLARQGIQRPPPMRIPFACEENPGHE
ncbi:tetratricopeptide repeat protein [Wenzhouxiangella sp. XN24]|uniref:tetratricopeptide repeat protein n=1 Tax=Wenzhouxiangella sp. XN24 TaxID=2713569 RepID=UPI0013EDC260|nr:tetratricopeptide repeat protein [Wenzhouxiangella sp. XN24]NGX15822.1 hypothetical protein [Wenzhouxiangella sp. XN24]